MAVDNPLRNFDFALEIEGVVQAHLQGVTVPKVEWTEHKQGSQGNRPDKKTPGKKIIGDMTIEKVVPAPEGDASIWEWFQLAAINLREAYARPGFLIELSNGVPINRWFLDDIWVKSIETSQYDTRGDNSANVLRTVVISCGDFIKL